MGDKIPLLGLVSPVALSAGMQLASSSFMSAAAVLRIVATVLILIIICFLKQKHKTHCNSTWQTLMCHIFIPTEDYKVSALENQSMSY